MHNKFIGLYVTSNPENKQSPYSSILFPLKSKVGELHLSGNVMVHEDGKNTSILSSTIMTERIVLVNLILLQEK